ncbi:MAG: hypothetical protein R2848_10375 [Thermomicrobiales bacterium]
MLLTEYYDANGQYGIISAAYDTELFGHRWFEGVDWLKAAAPPVAGARNRTDNSQRNRHQSPAEPGPRLAREQL